MLPRQKTPPGPSAIWGKEVHAWKEGKEPTKRIAKWFAETGLAKDTLTQFWPGGEHETLFLEHEGLITRLQDWPVEKVSHWDMFFIMDWINLDFLPWVDDLKTGRFLPETDTQLRSYSWLLQKVTHARSVMGTYTHWPRYPKTAGPKRTEGKIYASGELREWYDGSVIPAKRLAARDAAYLDTRPGEHCRWCPSKAACPEWRDDPGYRGYTKHSGGSLHLCDLPGADTPPATPQGPPVL